MLRSVGTPLKPQPCRAASGKLKADISSPLRHPSSCPTPHALCLQIKTALEAHIGAPVESVKVEAVKTQVVAGLNYRAKVTVNGTHKKTVAVYRPLPHTGLPLEVKAVEGEEAF